MTAHTYSGEEFVVAAVQLVIDHHYPTWLWPIVEDRLVADGVCFLLRRHGWSPGRILYETGKRPWEDWIKEAVKLKMFRWRQSSARQAMRLYVHLSIEESLRRAWTGNYDEDIKLLAAAGELRERLWPEWEPWEA